MQSHSAKNKTVSSFKQEYFKGLQNKLNGRTNPSKSQDNFLTSRSPDLSRQQLKLGKQFQQYCLNQNLYRQKVSANLKHFSYKYRKPSKPSEYQHRGRQEAKVFLIKQHQSATGQRMQQTHRLQHTQRSFRNASPEDTPSQSCYNRYFIKYSQQKAQEHKLLDSSNAQTISDRQNIEQYNRLQSEHFSKKQRAHQKAELYDILQIKSQKNKATLGSYLPLSLVNLVPTQNRYTNILHQNQISLQDSIKSKMKMPKRHRDYPNQLMVLPQDKTRVPPVRPAALHVAQAQAVKNRQVKAQQSVNEIQLNFSPWEGGRNSIIANDNYLRD